MDDRSIQFALFLVIAMVVPVLVAVGVDIARRIVAAVQHPTRLAPTSHEHEVR